MKINQRINSVIRKISLGILGIILVLSILFLAWSSNPARPMVETTAALESTSQVEITSDDWLAYKPVGKQPKTGFIFYPGGRVDYRAYAPTAQMIATNGYLVVITNMPLNLAVFDPDQAEHVIAAYPQIQNWVVGGHSLGGAMAARFAGQNQDQVDGLVLLASYPAESDTLKETKLQVLSVFGELDGLATIDQIDSSREFLPADTRYVSIRGGNHAQFGWYGSQSGDGQAQISRLEQQTQTVSAITEFLDTLENE